MSKTKEFQLMCSACQHDPDCSCLCHAPDPPAPSEPEPAKEQEPLSVAEKSILDTWYGKAFPAPAPPHGDAEKEAGQFSRCYACGEELSGPRISELRAQLQQAHADLLTARREREDAGKLVKQWFIAWGDSDRTLAERTRELEEAMAEKERLDRCLVLSTAKADKFGADWLKSENGRIEAEAALAALREQSKKAVEGWAGRATKAEEMLAVSVTHLSDLREKAGKVLALDYRQGPSGVGFVGQLHWYRDEVRAILTKEGE